MADLRHLAIILDAGRQKAEALQDAPLTAALEAMTEVAVILHQEGDDPKSLWHVPTEFGRLAERFR